ncbi:MAG TPA: hypothetical protein VMD59_14770 [Acidimicrobiales bacterium]|nr:hypothetical protein [Acidimicrobiales bacterium]
MSAVSGGLSAFESDRQESHDPVAPATPLAVVPVFLLAIALRRQIAEGTTTRTLQ